MFGWYVVAIQRLKNTQKLLLRGAISNPEVSEV